MPRDGVENIYIGTYSRLEASVVCEKECNRYRIVVNHPGSGTALREEHIPSFIEAWDRISHWTNHFLELEWEQAFGNDFEKFRK